MAEDTKQQSGLEKFIESFLQESNIQWMLGLGTLALLASSAMFVLSHWDGMVPLVRGLILIGYTGAIHAGGQFAYHRLSIRKTGTTLMALTLLLIPLVFFALTLESITGNDMVMRLGLIAVTAVFSGFAARRIWKHFLRSDKLSVLITYLVLAVFGAFASQLSDATFAIRCVAAILAWLTFATGATMANREVFWLTEEHRMPRIFGFFPIALFGLQFLAIFLVHLSEGIQLDWLGFGCVMTAIPVMLTADSFARVFQQRTGDLVRPLPWVIIGPIVLGLVMSVAGLFMAAMPLFKAGFAAYALVPASALFAVIMAFTAKRTKQGGFVWAMLIGVVMAYQFSPVFFIDLARSFVDHAATAVNKEKLELAYYGLTYQPLLIAIAGLACWFRKRQMATLFVKPMEHFALGFAVLLLGWSYTITGANFLVASVMVPFLATVALVSKRRDAMGAAIIAFITMTVQMVPFIAQVRPDWNLPAQSQVLCVAIGALLMQVAGGWIDRIGASRFECQASTKKVWFSSWQLAAAPTTLAAAAYWLVKFVVLTHGEPVLLSGAVLCGLLLVQHYMKPRPWFGEVAIGFGFLAALLHATNVGLITSSGGGLLMASVGLLAVWVASLALQRRTDKFAEAFALPTRNVPFAMLPIAMSCAAASIEMKITGRFDGLLSIAGMLAVSWCFIEGFRSRYRLLTQAAFVCLLGIEVNLVHVLDIANDWLPVIWATTAVTMVLITARTRPGTNQDRKAVELPAVIVLGGVTILSFIWLTPATMIAAIIALGGFLLQSLTTRDKTMRCLTLMALNWQMLGAVVRFCFPDYELIFNLGGWDFIDCSIPVAFIAATSAVLFRLPIVDRLIGLSSHSLKLLKDDTEQTQNELSENRLVADLIDSQVALLATVAVAGLVLSLGLSGAGITIAGKVMAGGAFGMLAVGMFRRACRTKKAVEVVASEAIVAAAFGYLAMFGVITFGRGICMFAVLGTAFATWLLARRMDASESTRFAARPLYLTARWLPMVTVGIAFGRFFLGRGDWLGINLLAVLMTAAFYFWRGVEEKSKGLIILAAGTLNAALPLLWKELAFTDWQFFLVPTGLTIIGLVELLKREIPKEMRNPLRYAGALTILVSPTFEIVSGSWAHLVSLLVLSVFIVLLAIGLRVRALVYAGTAFLLADLVAMVINASEGNLWIAGLIAGAVLIGLAAFFERSRDQLLGRVRLLTTELETWD